MFLYIYIYIYIYINVCIGRAVYQNSSQFIWPWSSQSCLGSFKDTGQLLSACDDNPKDGKRIYIHTHKNVHM